MIKRPVPTSGEAALVQGPPDKIADCFDVVDLALFDEIVGWIEQTKPINPFVTMMGLA
ncbi:hypothetical protein [Bradyrhizobium sp. CCBAU 11386]|uniref:hypothetical protein n=1 Tax=Bradyrhizobium sp. CCBAU 11386 TaxID=1630837 RepID=UPI002303EFF2|nr:hypothetical protein [Bradyrhizobium sp. CCBAU 11386]